MEARLRYAIGRNGDVYHLVDLRSPLTLCGLRVSLSARRQASSTDLKFVTQLKDRAKLCRHCDDALDQGKH